jgi:outer membrane receptor protein involved in Fe transport
MITYRRSAGWLFVLACAWAVTPLPGQATERSAATETASYRPTANTQGKSGNTISLVLTDVTVASALRMIADNTGLRLLVRDDILPAGTVSLNVHNAPVLDAVRQVLRGSGLIAQITPTGLLVITTRSNIAAAIAPGVISGTILDAATKRPVSGATVTLDGTNKRLVSGDNGAFRFPNVTPGEHTIVVRRLGYAPATRRVTVGEGATATLDIALQVAASTLDQVVVTGTVVATERKAIPNAITVITAQDIDRRGVTSMDQLFRGEVPGVFDQSRGDAGTSTNGYGLSYMTARGVSQVGSTATAAVTPIKTYVDGVEIAYPFYLSAIDPKTIERIELIPGPQASTIYGSGALGGVLQIFTKRGMSGAPRLMLNLSTGVVQSSFNNSLTPRHDFSAQFSGGDQNGLSYSAGGGYRYTGQWLPNLYQRDGNGFAALRYAPTSKLSADVSVRMSQRGIGSNTFTFLTQGEATGQYSFAPGDFVPTNVTYSVKAQTTGLGLTWQPTSWWQHRLVLGTDEISQGSFRNQPTFVTPADTLLSVVLIPARKQTVQYNTTVSGKLSDNVSGNLTAGADAMQYESTTSVASTPALSGTLSGGAASPPFISRTTEQTRGAFTQAQVAFWDAVFLTGGIRAENNSNYGRSYGLNYAPRYGVSVVHAVGPVTAKLRAAYGRATRAPASGAREAVFLTNTTYGTYESQIANPLLGPESQSGTEDGLELYFGSRGSLQITHYDQHVDNLIIGVTVDSAQSINPNTAGQYLYAPVSQRENVGAVRNTGWEGQGQLNLFTGLSLTGTLSNTRTRFQHLSAAYKCASLGTPSADMCLYPGAGLFNVAEHTGAIAANYATSKMNLNASVSYIGPRQFAYDIGDYYAATNGRLFRQTFTYAPVTAAGYATLDLRAAYQFTRQLQWTVLMQNAGNSHDGDYTGRRYLPAIGRVTMIGVRITQ